jgi:methylated-DNA-[protein]-cysteine S-methyltransferase
MRHPVRKDPLFFDIFNSPLGRIYMVFSGNFLCAISFEKPYNIPFKKDAAPENFIRELSAYFEGSGSSFRQKIKFLTGTGFEQDVWRRLKEIPFGETRSYKWMAERVGRPAAVRAVGRALSKNPVPIVIPCHRIIESDGSIGGYSSGVDRKRRLLDMEYYARMSSRPPAPEA